MVFVAGTKTTSFGESQDDVHACNDNVLSLWGSINKPVGEGIALAVDKTVERSWACICLHSSLVSESPQPD